MPLVVDWTTDDLQRTVVRLSGEVNIALWEEVTDDGPRITSDAFKQPQKDLGRALELALTNTVMAAYRERRDRDLPARGPSRAEQLRIEVAAETAIRLRPMLAAMLDYPGLDAEVTEQIEAFLDGGPLPPFMTDSDDSEDEEEPEP